MPNPGDPVLPSSAHSGDPSQMSDERLAHSIAHIEGDIADNEDDLDYYGPYRDLVDRNHSLWSRLNSLFTQLLARPGGCVVAAVLAICGIAMFWGGWGYDPHYYFQGFFPGMAWDYINGGFSYLDWPGWIPPLAAAGGIAAGVAINEGLGGDPPKTHSKAALGALGEPKEPEEPEPPDDPPTDTGTDTREPEKPQPKEPEKPGGEDVVPIVGDLNGPQEVM